MTEPEITIFRSARRHKISDERMLYALKTCPKPFAHPFRTGQRIFLAPDRKGIPLEVVAVVYDDGSMDIIHAMKLRTKYKPKYREVMG